ncbi:hypothetical protein DH2020_029046 [Rehmannia glutinosa]|uniref:Protein kinase domain-containing protein n=1 Tax=Rehmannia glutinosa TaxID=99300 RepID=A0ABR0VTB2_REHGL
MSQGLVGSLSSHIGNISFLRAIILQNNSFHGTIPQELGRLRRLEFLQIRNNSLVGPIPKNLSSNLVVLNLIGNSLSGAVPPELGYLYKLVALGLAENNLSGPIPPSFGNLTSVLDISLRSCGLNGEISKSLAQLGQLRVLQLGGNNLIGNIPFGLFNISTITLLGVAVNRIEGSIPSTIGITLPNLRSLFMGQNQLSGRVPISLSNASFLQELVMPINLFTGPMPSFEKLSRLQHFAAADNSIEDDISFISSLTNCTNLQLVDLALNPISGTILDTFANLSSQIFYMQISGTRVHGKIPSGIGNLVGPTFLGLSDNNLEGPVPVGIGKLTNLRRLYLGGNRFTNEIPSSFGNLSLLTNLYLDRNNFSGIVPHSLGNCINLLNLDLSTNNLSGPVPREIMSLSSISISLDLSYNALTGSIPSEVTRRSANAWSISKHKCNFLEGNQQLCGGSLEYLNLPPCTASKSSGINISTLLKILIPTATVAAFLCIIIVILHKRRTSKKNVSSLPSFNGHQFLRLSYADLLKATNGFSGTNLIGVGRFGFVYKGILDDGHTLVVVKVLNLVVKGASKSFMAEYNTLRGIRHRNLLKILSVCESIDFQGNDFKALVYEFKANGSLEKYMEQEGHQNEEIKNLNLIQRLNIAIDIAQALEYLHCGTDLTIVHGDLKPSNILLDHDMTACVGDFGLAKIISNILPPQESSSTIVIKGTIGYVPPV